MTKMFDIGPPKPISKNKKPATKSNYSSKKKKSQSGILVIVFIVCIFIFIFSLSNNTSSQYSQSDTSTAVNNLITTEETGKPPENPLTTPSKTEDNIENNVDQQEEKTNNNISENIEIVVLNGSGTSGSANKAKEILEKNNILVSEIGNTNNLYTKTTIYYTNENFSLVEKIQETLSNYNPKLEINTDFANIKKILVIIGNNE